MGLKAKRAKFWVSMALTAAMMIQSVSAVGAAETNGVQSVVLPVLNETKYENDGGTPRANNFDSQHLGVWIKGGTTFEIRQKNTSFGKSVKLKLRNNDSETEVETDIPANGNWVTLTAKVDSVPFIVSQVGDVNKKPEVEFKTANTYELPVYSRGEDEKAFFDEWNTSKAPYAVYECESVVMLVPECDKYANRFGTLEDLFDFYDGMLNQYNSFAGLSKDAQEPWNKLSGSRFLIKANKHGAGLGYYGGNEVAQNDTTMSDFLKYGWLINHEIGHGYMSFGGIDTGEVWNNIFGYYYQMTFRGGSEWLSMADSDRSDYEGHRASGGYSGGDYRDRLYFWVNMLDKIGPQKSFSYMYKTFRYNQYHGIGNDTSGPDMYARYLTEGSGYNVAAYFDLWGLNISDSMKSQLMQEGMYENVYPLVNLVGSASEADSLKAGLGIDSGYKLVTTNEIQKQANAPSGKVKFTLDDNAYSALKNKEIKLTDGVRVVDTVNVTGKSMEKDLKIGVYSVLLPDSGGQNISCPAYVVVKSGGQAPCEISCTDNVLLDFASDTFVYRGLYDVKYFTAVTHMEDPSNMTVEVEKLNVKPHEILASYLPGNYSSFIVKDEQGNEIYGSRHAGGDDTAEKRTVEIRPGYTIRAYHYEHTDRLSANSTYAPSYSLKGSERTTDYLVTEKGLCRITAPALTDEQKTNRLYDVVCSYMDDLKKRFSQASFKNRSRMVAEKASVMKAYETFSESQKNDFAEKYRGYFPFEADVSWTVDKIADKTYTGSPIVPTLTVKAGNKTLVKGTDYDVTFQNNTDVGTAKATIVGKGTYEGHVDEATFVILPKTGASLNIVLEKNSVIYTGGEKLPKATVTCDGATLTQGVDYTILYTNNVNVGTAKVSVKGIGNYEGSSAESSFSITKGKLQMDVVLAHDSYVYTGSRISPEVTVMSGGRELTNGVDYLVFYESNTNVGTGKVTVSAFGDNYADSSVVKNFTIKERTAPAPIGATEFSNWKIELGGISDWIFSKIDVNLESGKVTVNEEAGQAHYVFTTTYSSVGIYDLDGNYTELIKRRGNESAGKVSGVEYPIGEGYKIEIFHEEYQNADRAKIYASSDSSVTLPMAGKTTLYEVTKYGLKRISPSPSGDKEAEENFYSFLNTYMSNLVKENESSKQKFELQGNLVTEKAKVNKSVALLSAEKKAKFTSDYSGLYPFDAGHHYGNNRVCTVCGDVLAKSEQTEKPNVTGGVEEIRGTTAAMEYTSNPNGGQWKTCTAGSTTVTEGTWYVRLKETEDKLAGQAVTVKVERSVGSMSVIGEGSFEDRHIGYTDSATAEFTVKNTGNRQLSGIQVALEGSGKDSYVLNASAQKSTLNAGDSFTFTVQPKPGLAPGVYEAAVKISGQDGIGKSVSLRFTVTDHKFKDHYCEICKEGDALTKVKRGDINRDGKVDLLDLRLLLRKICKKANFNEEQMYIADMTEDGSVDLLDLRKMLRKICGKE